MYEKYYGLKGNPFAMTPDPGCYFMSESHREAFAGLSYGIANRRGFMTLVGEVGTGKTTLLNAILHSLDRSTVTILVRHTTVDREELLRIILHNLYTAHGPRQTDNKRKQDTGSFSPDSRISRLSRVELINEFYAFVTGEYMAYQPPPLLIIDEAQNLSVDVLEEVRLLTNLEDPKTKMLQLILAGQPELEDKLLRTDLRQLRQRIAVSARLEPLSMAETSDYIAYRLERAGCQNKNLFTRPAVEAIWSASKGSPRTINVLCDHALVTAFAMGMKEVEGPAAREAVNDVMCLRLREPPIKKPGPYLVNHFDSRPDDSRDDEEMAHTEGQGGRVG
jgi:type II secretory pathway predicted ATPase ExeA